MKQFILQNFGRNLLANFPLNNVQNIDLICIFIQDYTSIKKSSNKFYARENFNETDEMAAFEHFYFCIFYLWGLSLGIFCKVVKLMWTIHRKKVHGNIADFLNEIFTKLEFSTILIFLFSKFVEIEKYIT